MNKKPLLLILLVLLFCFGCADKKDPVNDSSGAAAPKYVLAKVEKKGVEQTMKLPAQLAAYQEVSIFPKVNGYVTSVFVDIGSHVRTGQLLMKLEAPELIQAVAQAKERWARAKSDFTIDKENYERLNEASQTPGAISPLDLATAKGKMDADSALANAERSNWEIQQTMLGYLTITAPFSGVITVRNVHPGALVSAEGKENNPMLELKQIDRLRLQIDIPESIAGSLKNKDTISFYLSAFPGKEMKGRIARISMNINMQFRSERIELDVYNKDEVLAPGMYADVLFNAKGNPYALSVPKSAVVTSTERKYVLAIRDGKTVKINVRTGNENDTSIEVIGDLKEGEQVISNANDEIKEGITVN